MADGGFRADGERKARIRVQHTAVLHVAARADDDGLVVATATVLNQTLASSSMTILPTSVALSATQ
jgi:hypothetical protein